MMVSFNHVRKSLVLFITLGTLAACATAEPKPMMMGSCDPAKCAMCAQKMNMGKDMNCEMMKSMPADKMKMMDECMKKMGMKDGKMMGGMGMMDSQNATSAVKAKMKKQPEEDHTAHHPDADE